MFNEMDLLTGITMVIIGFAFLGLSIASYAMEPCKCTILEISGSIIMIIAAFYTLIKTVKA